MNLVLELNRHIERFFREIENERRKNQTDVEAFLEKYEARKRKMVPLIAEIELKNRTKAVKDLSWSFL